MYPSSTQFSSGAVLKPAAPPAQYKPPAAIKPGVAPKPPALKPQIPKPVPNKPQIVT